MRGNDNSSGSNIGNHYQQQDDLYAPLDSNGEMSSRSLSSNQRPPEGELVRALSCPVLLLEYVFRSFAPDCRAPVPFLTIATDIAADRTPSTLSFLLPLLPLLLSCRCYQPFFILLSFPFLSSAPS
jgi:hypothetical protein